MNVLIIKQDSTCMINNNKYYNIRDILGNILEPIDNKWNIVLEYK